MSTLAIQYMYLLMTRYFIISEYDSISIRKAPIIMPYFVHKQNLVCMNIIHATLSDIKNILLYYTRVLLHIRYAALSRRYGPI